MPQNSANKKPIPNYLEAVPQKVAIPARFRAIITTLMTFSAAQLGKPYIYIRNLSERQRRFRSIAEHVGAIPRGCPKLKNMAKEVKSRAKVSGQKKRTKLTSEESARLKELAKTLYTQNNISIEALAEKVGVTPKTLSNWIEEGHWSTLKENISTTLDEQIRVFTRQLKKLNDHIEETTGFPDSKQADTIKKLTASINDLTTKTNLGQIIQVTKDFANWLPASEREFRDRYLKLSDSFIKDNATKQ